MEDLWRLLGRLHPAIVHFPIALLVLAAAIEVVLAASRPRHRMSPTAMTCLVVAALAAALAAWFGWLNADHEPHGTAAASFILWHRWIGITTAVAAWVALICCVAHRANPSDWSLAGYRGGLIIAAIAVSVAGYLGGEVTHGSGYLTSVMPWAEKHAPVVVDEPPPEHDTEPGPRRVRTAERKHFDDLRFSLVQPIFQEHCSHCHGPDRQKGGLQLVPIAAAFAGPEEYWVIRPGAPEESLLVERISLATDDADLMPADGERLAVAQIEAVVAWIAGGAGTDADAGTGTGAEAGADAGAGADSDAGADAGTVADTDTDAPSPAELASRADAISAIVARGGSAVPLAAGSFEVDVNLSLARPLTTDDDLEVLNGLRPYLVRLNLSRTAVSDEGLVHLAGFGLLRRLRLDRCAITDAGVAHLTALESLTHLNLFGTGIGDEGLRSLAELDSLRAVYVWRTHVTEDGIAWLRERRPELDVQGGVTPAAAGPS